MRGTRLPISHAVLHCHPAVGVRAMHTRSRTSAHAGPLSPLFITCAPSMPAGMRSDLWTCSRRTCTRAQAHAHPDVHEPAEGKAWDAPPLSSAIAATLQVADISGCSCSISFLRTCAQLSCLRMPGVDRLEFDASVACFKELPDACEFLHTIFDLTLLMAAGVEGKPTHGGRCSQCDLARSQHSGSSAASPVGRR
jgi:hypothetical protein